MVLDQLPPLPVYGRKGGLQPKKKPPVVRELPPFKGRPRVKTFRRYDDDPSPHEVRVRVYDVLKDSSFQWLKERQLANARIHHGDDWTSQVEQDFKAAQVIFDKLMEVEASPKSQRHDKEEARTQAQLRLAKLKTQFCIAQYRGITYKTSAFDQTGRQGSRETVETGMAIYSGAVFKAANVSPASYFSKQCTPEDHRRLEVAAEQLKGVLLLKRDSGPFEYLGYKFDNQAHALQDIYTNKYDWFHSCIQAYLGQKSGWFARKEQEVRKALAQDESFKKKPPEIQESTVMEKVYGFNPPKSWAPYEGLPNAECPFVSSGDVPRHALKYAYGRKFYEGHHHERLLPRWNPLGRAERPYTGKVFVTLHSLDEYVSDAPLHVPSLVMKGKIVVPEDIVLERETTFPAYIPKGRLSIEHIAKFPSFGHGWLPAHLEKYGLDKYDFKRFQKEVLQKKVQGKVYGKFSKKSGVEPDSDDSDDEEGGSQDVIRKVGGSLLSLESWLVNYHEARLIELARRVARSQGMVLIYRDELGQLSRELPEQHQKEAQELRKKLTEEKEKRKTVKSRHFDKGVELLKKRLTSISFDTVLADGFVTHPVPGDGNCLFHALAGALGHVTGLVKTHVQLRQEVCHYYQRDVNLRNAQHITNAYLAEMSRTARSALDVARWGSDAELIAFCMSYRRRGIRVRVYSRTYPAPGYFLDFEPFGVQVQHTLHLFHNGGGHWEWLTPK